MDAPVGCLPPFTWVLLPRETPADAAPNPKPPKTPKPQNPKTPCCYKLFEAVDCYIYNSKCSCRKHYSAFLCCPKDAISPSNSSGKRCQVPPCSPTASRSVHLLATMMMMNTPTIINREEEEIVEGAAIMMATSNRAISNSAMKRMLRVT